MTTTPQLRERDALRHVEGDDVGGWQARSPYLAMDLLCSRTSCILGERHEAACPDDQGCC